MDTDKVITARFTSTLRLSLAPESPSQRGARLLLQGALDHTFQLEMAESLPGPWTPLGTLINRFGTVEFLDTGAIGKTQRFYRATEP